MKKTKTLILSTTLLAFNLCYSQIGIGTTNPQGSFHIDPLNNNPTTGVPNKEQQLDDLIVTPAGKVGIGTTTPQAALDVNSNSGGVAVPRLTTEQINALVLPAKSSIVYNTTTEQLNYNSGTPESPIWSRVEASDNYTNEVHFTPSPAYFTSPSNAGYLDIYPRYIPRNSNYNTSLFKPNPNGTISILKKGMYEICSSFSSARPVGMYSLSIYIKRRSDNSMVFGNNPIGSAFTLKTDYTTYNYSCRTFNVIYDDTYLYFSIGYDGTIAPGRIMNINSIKIRKID